ncbi:MAG: hypothetical protein KatS3mg105_4143 [Gemmatales bacterium]|nr:MAG: hypothetical protein KatS3mg105_4143 [Gemmatales bacterium]
MLILPELDETKCIGCGDCVDGCPEDCLERMGSLPWLPRPTDCTSCGLCALLCPTDAIRLLDKEREPVMKQSV